MTTPNCVSVGLHPDDQLRHGTAGDVEGGARPGDRAVGHAQRTATLDLVGGDVRGRHARDERQSPVRRLTRIAAARAASARRSAKGADQRRGAWVVVLHVAVRVRSGHRDRECDSCALRRDRREIERSQRSRPDVERSALSGDRTVRDSDRASSLDLVAGHAPRSDAVREREHAVHGGAWRRCARAAALRRCAEVTRDSGSALVVRLHVLPLVARGRGQRGCDARRVDSTVDTEHKGCERPGKHGERRARRDRTVRDGQHLVNPCEVGRHGRRRRPAAEDESAVPWCLAVGRASQPTQHRSPRIVGLQGPAGVVGLDRDRESHTCGLL